jgi:RNA polymerase sigma-70 factor (ECF subfamily)
MSMTHQTTPLSLLERARARDNAAWQQLIDLYRPLVSHWCRRASVQGHDAEDVIQEVFAAAAAALHEFRRDRPGDTFRGWLGAITRNQISLHYRRSQLRPQAEGSSGIRDRMQDIPDPFSQSDPAEQAEVDQLYRRAFDLIRGEIEERSVQMFWLTVIEGRSSAAVAEEMGVSANAVRQARSRVLRRLKQEVGDLLG